MGSACCLNGSCVPSVEVVERTVHREMDSACCLNGSCVPLVEVVERTVHREMGSVCCRVRSENSPLYCDF